MSDHGGRASAQPAALAARVMQEIQQAMQALAEGDFERSRLLAEQFDQDIRATAAAWDAVDLLAVQAAHLRFGAQVSLLHDACGSALRKLECGRYAVDCYSSQSAMAVHGR